jgi:lipid-binding SYLF domain-containing protein
MSREIIATAIAIALAAGLASPDLARGAAKSKAEQQAAIRKEAKVTLDKLYRVHPAAKPAIQKAAGYAAFDNFGMHLFVLSTARGKGLAVSNATKKETFMKMLSVGAGFGMGVKDFRAVFVFETPQALDSFITSGWDADAHVEASAKTAQRGAAFTGAISVAPGVWVYQLTEKGLALEATLQGTKYSKEDTLN